MYLRADSARVAAVVGAWVSEPCEGRRSRSSTSGMLSVDFLGQEARVDETRTSTRVHSATSADFATP